MSDKGYKLGIVGAMGLVGSELMEALERRKFPAASMKLFSSMNTAGERVEFMDDSIVVEPVSGDFHEGLDVVFFAVHQMVSRDLAEQAAGGGALVIDASPCFRRDNKVPMVVPEINGDQIASFPKKNVIVSSPSAQAVFAALVTHPLDRKWTVKRVVATVIHGSTSGGRSGFTEHQNQTIDLFNQQEMKVEKFPRRTAFNIFPQVGRFKADDNEGERELMDELPRLLGRPVPVAATSVQAPVFCGIGMSLDVELGGHAEPHEVRELLAGAPGLLLADDPENLEYPDTLTAMEHDKVLVGRVREDPSKPDTVQVWLSGDNLRKGSAVNMVQIAETALGINPPD